jgi:hypothetical protein
LTEVTGNVTVTLREVFSTSQMIFSGVLPVSEGIPLNCGGEFFLSASQNNSDVYMKNGMMMEIYVPTQALDNSMQLSINRGTNDDVVDWRSAAIGKTKPGSHQLRLNLT